MTMSTSGVLWIDLEIKRRLSHYLYVSDDNGRADTTSKSLEGN
jgi:hypothetical protein